MKKQIPALIIIAFLMGAFSQLMAQAPVWRYANLSGGTAWVYQQDMLVTQFGETYQIGEFGTGNLNLGLNVLSNPGLNNGYIAKYDIDGNVEWARNVSSDASLSMHRIMEDGEGNLVVIGSYYNGTTVQIDSDIAGFTSTLRRTYFVAKLSGEGTVLSFKSLFDGTSTSSVSVYDMDIDEEGNLLVVGSYYDGTINIGDDSFATAQNFELMFLAKYGPDLTPIWAETNAVSSSTSQWARTIATQVTADENNNIFISGVFDDMNPIFGTDSLLVYNYNEVFIVAYDGNANVLWMDAIVGGNYEYPDQVNVDTEGDILLSGTFDSDSIKIDGVWFSNGGGWESDYYIAKYSLDGTVLDKKVYDINISGGEKKEKETGAKGFWTWGPDDYTNLVPTPDGGYVVATRFESDTTHIGGKTFYNNTFQDGLVFKFDATGNLEWSKQLAGFEYSGIEYITVDDLGNITIAGEFYEDLFLIEEETTISGDSYTQNVAVLQFSPAGNVKIAEGILAEVENSVYLSGMSAANNGSIYIQGDFYGSFKLGGVQYSGQYTYNNYLVRLAYDTRFEGQVSDPLGVPVTNGLALLFSHTQSQESPIIAASLLDVETGSYMFDGFVPGDYIIYALPDISAYPEFSGTYHISEIIWGDALVLDAVASPQQSGLDITLIEIPTDLSGPGNATGSIETDDPEVSKKRLFGITEILGKPVKKVRVILTEAEDEQKKSLEAGNPIAETYTDDQGQFSFGNLPEGNYTILVDIPGLPQYSSYTFTISSTNQSESGLDFIVTSTGIEAVNPTSVGALESELQILAYPNPGNGLYRIDSRGIVLESVEIHDVTGKVVLSLSSGTNGEKFFIDLRQYPDGFYFLKMKAREGTGVFKIIKH